MNILLTANFERGLFCNGLQQNIVFLAELIKDIGLNPIICINHSIDNCIDPPADILIIEEREIKEYSESLNFIINSAFVLERGDIDFIKEKNPRCRNIHVIYGNSMLADIERCSWNNAMPIDKYKVDEAWISPHYKFSFNYFKTYYNTDRVLELPYIWSSKYVDLHEEIWKKTGKTCLYSPDREKNIAILEPNLNLTKHCLPSIMIVEEYFRNYNRNSFNKLTSYCSQKLADKKFFKFFMWGLDITNNGKINFSSREKVSKIFSSDCNIVLSHQLMNALNYTYLEALHFNIPLVHNSEHIKDAGYYYKDYDIKQGAIKLNEALNYHDKNIEDYNAKARAVIERYNPKSPAVQERYRKLFE
jgi:hypothetical protein